MTSNINPNNIDGTYPVAGQDNNSQGFRDNFTNTKTNFEYAADEITNLQNNAILKSALTGTTLNNDMLGSLVYNGVAADFGLTRVALGTVLTSSATIDFSLGHYQTLTTNGALTLGFSNFPPAGVAGFVTVRVTVASTSHTLTLPVQVGSGASASSVSGIEGISSNVITFAETGTYEFQFHTDDGGSTIYLSELTRPRNRYTNPLFLDISDSFTANSNINLSTTTTVITSNANLTANLLTTSSGQIKILAYGNTNVGNTLVNVVNAGWKTSGNGTANLSAVGSAATFQYIGDKWFCVGNNGVTFS